MARVLVLVLCACLAPLAQAQRDAPRIAGAIELTDGDVLLEGRDGKTRLPANGENVFEGDTVTTFPNGEIHLQMADGASLIVRENSKITIAQYVADGGDNDRSLIDLAKGALRSITGWIGQYNRANYKIRTPLVTIGVRGTDHEPSHLLEGDPRGEPGSYDKVNEGRTYMQGPQGTVDVPANRVVFRGHARGARAPPRHDAGVLQAGTVRAPLRGPRARGAPDDPGAAPGAARVPAPAGRARYAPAAARALPEGPPAAPAAGAAPRPRGGAAPRAAPFSA